METSRNTGNQIIALLVGAALGTTLGILFAPRKGTKTRHRLQTRAKYVARDIKHKMNKEVQKVEDIVDANIDEMIDSKKNK